MIGPIGDPHSDLIRKASDMNDEPQLNIHSDEQGDTGSPTSQQPPSAAGSEEPTAEAQVDQLAADLTAAEERLLRAHAELENYRKRTRRDLEEQQKYAHMPLLAELLSVVDNAGRAIEAAEKSADSGSLLEGFRMIARQLETILEKFGCHKIEAQGQPFDPHRHEAISQQPSAEAPAGTIIYVTQEGYLLHDRVIRPSQVIVSSGQGQ